MCNFTDSHNPAILAALPPRMRNALIQEQHLIDTYPNMYQASVDMMPPYQATLGQWVDWCRNPWILKFPNIGHGTIKQTKQALAKLVSE